MARLMLGRLPALVGVLLALTFVVYLIDAVVPANPVAASLGAGASHAQIVARESPIVFVHDEFGQPRAPQRARKAIVIEVNVRDEQSLHARKR